MTFAQNGNEKSAIMKKKQLELYLQAGYTYHRNIVLHLLVRALEPPLLLSIIYSIRKNAWLRIIEFYIKEIHIYISVTQGIVTENLTEGESCCRNRYCPVKYSSSTPIYLRLTTNLETFIQCVRNSLVRRVLFLESSRTGSC